jgi:hypothetical protein
MYVLSETKGYEGRSKLLQNRQVGLYVVVRHPPPLSQGEEGASVKPEMFLVMIQ